MERTRPMEAKRALQQAIATRGALQQGGANCGAGRHVTPKGALRSMTCNIDATRESP